MKVIISNSTNTIVIMLRTYVLLILFLFSSYQNTITYFNSLLHQISRRIQSWPTFNAIPKGKCHLPDKTLTLYAQVRANYFTMDGRVGRSITDIFIVLLKSARWQERVNVKALCKSALCASRSLDTKALLFQSNLLDVVCAVPSRCITGSLKSKYTFGICFSWLSTCS